MKTVGHSKRLLLACMFTGTLFAQTAEAGSPRVTAVTGESWLLHLHRAFDETSMGKTGRLGPPTPVRGQQNVSAEKSSLTISSRDAALSGADLYRLNCRGCHGEFGTGAPPEINSVINPVRAGSVAAVMARMKNAGVEMSYAEAVKLSKQSRAVLLQRLHNGGQDMPAFSQLTQPEVQSLLAYLNELADVPGGQRQPTSVRTSPLRVGELIVKSTCHICHSATGENPTPQELAKGAVPPLSTLTLRVNRSQFVRKVTQGAPITMGSPELLYRGRMPVFYYLTADEAADVYDYLLSYPPAFASSNDVIILSKNDASAGANPPHSSAATAIAGGVAPVRNRDSVWDGSIVLPVAGLLVLLLVAGTMGITVHEMVKLGTEELHRQAADDTRPVTVGSLPRDLVA